MLLRVLPVCLLAVGVSGTFKPTPWKKLQVKYDPLLGYYPMKFKQEQCLKDKSFAVMQTDNLTNICWVSHKEDPKFAVGYDKCGNIAGVKICYIKEDLPKKAQKNRKEFPHEYYGPDKPWLESECHWGYDCWCTTLLFWHPDLIKKGGHPSNDGKTLGDGVRIQLEKKGEWVELPRDECEAEKMGFTEQKCMIGMGKHYFYKLTKETDCKKFCGIFLLYEHGEMVEMGLIPFGTFSTSTFGDVLTRKNKRTWNENPGSWVADMLLSDDSPPCLKQWIDDYGTISMHLFFIAHARTIQCTYPNQIPWRCKEKGVVDSGMELLNFVG